MKSNDEIWNKYPSKGYYIFEKLNNDFNKLGHNKSSQIYLKKNNFENCCFDQNEDYFDYFKIKMVYMMEIILIVIFLDKKNHFIQMKKN